MNNKELIINYYYEEKLNTVEISRKLDISKQYVGRIVKTDLRYEKERINRKENNLINRKKKKYEYKKRKRQEIREARLDDILERQHIQASIELSSRKTINNRAYRNWNLSIYEFHNKTKEYRIKEDIKNKISYAIPKKIKWY